VVAANHSESNHGFADYFEFFALPQQFRVDLQALDRAYLKIQQEVHPDKFVRSSDSEKRQSLQIATYANTAHQTLKHGIRRGIYLCGLKGFDPQLETNTSMPKEFLMQQMALREEMDEARGDLAALTVIQEQANRELKKQMDEIESQFDTFDKPELAMLHLRAALFFERLLEELDHQMMVAST
jgi:molecular chaperone HscB